ncbi:FG-GAP-like repeat-containing protein [Streptomyces sp. NPDC097619]|uniref:FG-GAP-like repeat-containing protein n=1 Tax=Streptomyces sp. NPDC097619 TaxID=3157228 RepID=UPI003318E957
MRPSILRRAVGTVAAVTAALAGLLTTAPQAAAADGRDRCPANRLCLFRYPDFQGEMKVLSASAASLGAFDDKASSLVNKTRLYGMLHTRPGYDCAVYCAWIEPGASMWLNGPEYEGRLDNAVSSVRLASTEFEIATGLPYLRWYREPAFRRPADLPAAGRFGDLDGDRRPDLLERAADGRLWFLDGGTDARGTARGSLVGGGWNTMTQLVRHGDYGTDGREDLFARDTAGVLWFYPGDGKGAFGTRSRVGAGWNTMREIAAAGDLTGDGRADLLARDTVGVLWTYPGDGKGAFGTRVRVGAGWNTVNRLVTPGDFDGDGRADLLARDGARALWLYPGNGEGGFAARKKLSGTWPADAPVIATGDVTGDGRSDLMTPEAWSRLTVLPGTGRGGLGPARTEMDWDDSDAVRVF